VIPVIATGVENLDEILGGGIPRRSMTLILGVPGSGKTILAEQIAVHQAQQGERVLIFTALSESHEQLLTTLRQFSFFDETLIGDQIRFINIQTMLRDGLEATADAIVEMVRTENASVVVLDGFRGVAGFANANRDVHLFLYEVRTRLAFLNVTTLVTLETDMNGANDSGALTLADGIVTLHNTLFGVRHRRSIEVQKLRAMNHLDGLHALTITADGISCYPRHEAVYRTINYAYLPDRVRFGLPELDAMLNDGLNRATGALIAGSPGTGKTLLSLHYLMEGATVGESGVYLGFHESAEQLYGKAEHFGLDLRGAVARGTIALECIAPVELEPDVLAATIRERVEQLQAQRLVIDPIAQIENAILEPHRATGFFASLLNYLRERNVTSVMTREISPFPEPRLVFNETPVSVLTENLLILRSLEYQERLFRVISVLKMRFSAFDPSLREFRIEDGGVHVLPIGESGEGVMTGITQQEQRRSQRNGGAR
jgi:circadian clock protein KaiC